MRFRNAPIKRKSGKSIALTFLLLLTLPIFIFTLLENQSFDFRNKAFEDIELSETNPCILTFPNVNPYSLEVNRTVRVQIDAMSKDFGIKSINVTDSIGNILITKEYPINSDRISESFPFTPQLVRSYELSGKFEDNSGKVYECVISSPYDVKGVRAITSNSKPVFTTTPRSSIPSQNIQTGATYEYTIEAEDVDGDTINYAYSFTPGENWLKPTIIDDGGGGKLTIKLKGSTQKAGSYLANIFIHDGYSMHLSSQSWVISVSPKGNTNPVVKIIEPLSPQVISDNTPLKITWDGVDDGEIIRYEIYISSNPTNESSWKVIDKNVRGTQTTYNVNLSDMSDGAYRIIVRAIDNQTPPGVGMDVSEEILISRKAPEPEKPDDQVILPEPQVINVSPTSTDSISNTTPTIKASLVSTEDSGIDESSINIKLDNKDITEDIKINKISESEYTVIYIPEQPLSTGLHKVELTFKDTRGASTQKSWTFTISSGEEDQDGSMFNIFGFEIAKRTVFIIVGGLALIVLAIVVPMIIVAMWKDGSKETETNNYALPQSLPSQSEIPVNQEETDLKELTKEVFEAPEPDIEILEQSSIPEPEEDLTALYKEIENLAQEDEKKNNGESNST